MDRTASRLSTPTFQRSVQMFRRFHLSGQGRKFDDVTVFTALTTKPYPFRSNRRVSRKVRQGLKGCETSDQKYNSPDGDPAGERLCPLNSFSFRVFCVVCGLNCRIRIHCSFLVWVEAPGGHSPRAFGAACSNVMRTADMRNRASYSDDVPFRE